MTEADEVVSGADEVVVEAGTVKVLDHPILSSVSCLMCVAYHSP